MSRCAVVVSLLMVFVAGPAFAADAPQVIDLTEAFTKTFDATAGQPESDRIAAFKTQVAPLFPAYYGIARFEGQMTQDARDRQIARAFERFPAIRDTYTAKARQFREAMATNIASFRQAFPDFKPERPVYLLHSLGEMDGGTRNLDGATQLIFGADGMAMYHQGFRSESAFFHHELFHIHHHPRLGTCEAVWCSLWIEGVAVHVAASLNPDATDAELLLDFPAGAVSAVRANLPAALAHAKSVLDSTDMKVLRALFSSGKDETGLPPRRGYLLGYMLSQEIAKGRALRDLPNLSREDVRSAMIRAIDTLAVPKP